MLQPQRVKSCFCVTLVAFAALGACSPETTSDGMPTPASKLNVAGPSALAGAGQGAGSTLAGRPADVQATSRGGAGASGNAGGRAGNLATATGGMAGVASAVTGGAGRAAVGGSSAPTAGTGSAGKGIAGGGAAGAGATGAGKGETGRLVGMTDAHNAVRMRIKNPAPDPPLPPLVWSTEIAQIAQTYADTLAAKGDNCLQQLQHSERPGLGENLAAYGGRMATAVEAVEGWASEEDCYTFGPISRENTDCDLTCAREEKNSNGCGHYTQVVWRGTTELGCGVATCGSGRTASEIWVCNYRAPGNFVGMKPY